MRRSSQAFLSVALHCLILVAIASIPVASQARLYQYVDEDGITHYTNAPKNDSRFRAAPSQPMVPKDDLRPSQKESPTVSFTAVPMRVGQSDNEHRDPVQSATGLPSQAPTHTSVPNSTNEGGVWHILSILIAFFGALKIVLSLIWFTLATILSSKSKYETYAKIMVTSLSLLVLFWLSNSLTLGFSVNILDIFLVKTATSSLAKGIVGILGAAFIYFLFSLLEVLAKATKDHRYAQSLCVFVSTLLIAVLVPFFIKAFQLPGMNRYIFFDFVIGVTMGGILYVVKLLFRLARTHVH